MSLVKLIAQADERALAASGLASLDRCLPLLAEENDVLRPLWAGVQGGERDWPDRLAEARTALDEAIEAEAAAGAGAEVTAADVTAELIRSLLGSAPAQWAAEPLRAWADTCSVVALEIHQKLDAVGDTSGDPAAADRLARCREDRTAVPDAVDGSEGGDGVGPLVAGELRRQIRILEILTETEGPAGLRQALDVSTEGQRVLRAVVSRRARARS
ncbi:hypothetical protein [Streptomyces paludis]|uniref:Uncharacterized protein n=1 Tax=Streptomyces paludis TaxID=2282738 RepID=A0A345HT29_9ACTN|nr:hypothetical protein [Streptomyces paludis]AXG79853.1 hypothetical protein DVK44_21825 [Streptomyces paludis]